MGTSHPVPAKWEPFQDRFSDSAPEVPPTFRTYTNARLVRRYQVHPQQQVLEARVGAKGIVFHI